MTSQFIHYNGLCPSQGHKSQQRKSSLITHPVTQKWLTWSKAGITSEELIMIPGGRQHPERMSQRVGYDLYLS